MFASKYLLAVASMWACGAVGAAVPVEVGVEKRAIDTTTFNNLRFFSQYAAAAYCTGNNNSTGTKLTCPIGNCPLVQSANTHTLTEFENSIQSDITGFAAYDTTNRLIVVSFRGSRSVRNWIANLQFPTTATDICADCQASTGFWNSWNEARASVVAAVNAARALHPDFKIVVVGHSLGGALANLAAGTLRASGLTVDLYTYGAPKVGMAGIANYLTSTSRGASFRVTKTDDPVPRLPPALLGYRHTSPEYYITSGNADPTPNDITRFTASQAFQGNEGDLGFDTEGHSYYFGRTGACLPEGFEF